jgi:hypothetical protein
MPRRNSMPPGLHGISGQHARLRLGDIPNIPHGAYDMSALVGAWLTVSCV